MELWTGAECAFALKVSYKNGDTFVITQREFRREFGIHRNRAVPSAHAIKTWIRNFFSAEPVASKFRTQVLMAWAERLPNDIYPSVAEPEKNSTAKSPDSLTHPV
jgi:hypothetical protein